MAFLNGKSIQLIAVKGEKGDNGLCAPLASFVLGGGSGSGYAVINTADNRITFPNDTLIVGNNEYYRLTSEKNNNDYTFNRDDLGGTSAVNIVYQISSGSMLAKRFDAKINVNDEILLCSIRYTNEPAVSITCPYELVTGEVTYAHRPKCNAFNPTYLAPLIAGYSDKYVEVDSTKGTIKFPNDTLIVNPIRSATGDVITYQLSDEKGNNICNYLEVTTSTAVKIYYNPATDSLIASIYGYAPIEYGNYILLAVVRTSQKTVACTLPYIYDGLLSGIDYSEWVEKYDNKNIRSVNHRGYIDAPENTLAAYKLSKKKGFDYVECDVSFTADGHAVLLHDSTVDRTSNGTGNISNLTLEEVRALDFGSWKSSEYTGEQIPLFEEFIALCKNLGLHAYIELKDGTQEQVKALVSVVNRYGMKGNVSWIAFNAEYLRSIKSVDERARLGFIVGEVNAGVIETAQQLQSGKNEVFIDCSYGNVNETAAGLCANAGIPLEVWTINDETALKNLDVYVSGYSSDNLVASKVWYKHYLG
jgi:glycerophosphoryl diester phosphodiesterase